MTTFTILRSNFLILSLIVSFVLSLVTDWYSAITLFLFVVTVLAVLDKLGKGLVLREMVVLYTIFICLVAPVIGYQVYNYQNYIAWVFVKFMQVPENDYFKFTLPAVSAFSVAMCFPIRKNRQIMDEGVLFQELINQGKKQLDKSVKKGILIVSLGIVMFFVVDFLPETFRFAGLLFFFASFAGILYIYYCPAFPSKKILLSLFSLFIIWGTVESGVFTVIVYMGITLFSFLFLGKKFALWKKILVFAACSFILLIVQNVKATYRDVTWKDVEYTGNKTQLFGNIVLEKVKNLNQLFDEKGFFPIYTRANQGFNISLVMKRIPAMQDYDGGSRLLTIAASSFVPRFLWPDKPEAGGKESMMYFTGKYIAGWSTNVSPLGEAYGSFGVTGGIFYMFLLGLFIRWAYLKVFVISQKLPLVIFWIPVLFYQVTYSMETDTLQILNSLLKSGFFLWLLYKLVPAWFGVAKKAKGLMRANRHAAPIPA
jgi:hypothetical protein